MFSTLPEYSSTRSACSVICSSRAVISFTSGSLRPSVVSSGCGFGSTDSTTLVVPMTVSPCTMRISETMRPGSSVMTASVLKLTSEPSIVPVTVYPSPLGFVPAIVTVAPAGIVTSPSSDTRWAVSVRPTSFWLT